MLPAVEKPRDQVAILIELKVRETPLFWPDCCIYKVPERFRKGNEEFYKPLVVSIGPYHFHQGSFPQMQIFKLKYLEAFLSRNHLSLDQCLGLVRTWEEIARRYYADPIDLSSDKFAELMLVDAIFVLELLLRSWFSKYVDDCDRIYGKLHMIQDVMHDVILIENQIPFFVLEGLYDLVDSSSKGNFKLVELTHEFFKRYEKIDMFGAGHAPVPGVEHGVQHFVDFIRYYYLPPPPREDVNHEKVYEIPPSVTMLDDAGVKFVSTSKTFLLDIQFNNGRLVIPKFTVDDLTEPLLRNLLVFEQCHDHHMRYISQFVFLMGCMMRTSKDADLLTEHEIISSMLGINDELSALINRIGQGVGFDGRTYYYLSLSKKLNAYCKDPWHKWKANLKRDYFNTPWKFASTIAAIILLVLTLIQAICSILSV